MSDKKNGKGVIKPLAAAFLISDPEEDVAKENNQSAKTESKSSVRAAAKVIESRSVGELTKEETRVMLKEQLVTRISTESVKAVEAKKEEMPEEEPKKPTEKKAVENKKAESKGKETVKAQAEKEQADKPEKKQAPAKKAEKTSADATAEAGKGAEIYFEYNGKSYLQADLVRRAVTIWVRKLKRGRSNLQSLEMYVKPQENRVYYVFNKTRSGSFEL